jgi:hypothetical protein
MKRRKWLVDATHAFHRIAEPSRRICDPLQAPKSLRQRRGARRPAIRKAPKSRPRRRRQRQRLSSRRRTRLMRRRETYDAIREIRVRISAPVPTMSCDTVKWKETDPCVRPRPPLTPPLTNIVVRTSASRRSSRPCCHRRPRTR